MPPTAEVVIVGAGAAGLFCAREAGARGRRVVVVDHSPEPGRKLLVTGGGRCNFTNLHAGPDAYVSANPPFCVSALSTFTPDDIVRFVDAHGIPYHEKTQGQLFCDGPAAAIRDALVEDCRTAGVEFALARRIEGIAAEAGGGFRIGTDHGVLRAPRLVIATGGSSASQTGATGFGFAIAKSFRLKVIHPEPALVGLRWSEPDRGRWADLAGVALPDVTVTCRKTSTRNAVLLTHTGLSGPAILDASLHWRGDDPLTIDLLPGFDPRIWFESIRRTRGSEKPEAILLSRLPTRFAARFAADHFPPTPLARISDGGIARLVEAVKAWRVEPAGTEGFERAEVTRGGVDTRELSSKTMEARRMPGLFFIGEVVDVTGRLGGYNLHWAWASAFAAAQAL
ncbi:MAG: aminoacetone oxidase family FAD-binding enzyme [Candidatus Coatesbacteria bacterium]